MAPEHRQLTVLFCDLVGSTTLSEQLDTEDYRDLIRTYQETAAEPIDQYDGYIAQHLGDGLLVYFGYPISFEDNALRAVKAGLGIIDGIKNLTLNLQIDKQINIEVKIGIHTGNVLLDEIENINKTEYLALGDTPNIASRIKDHASPNQLIISSKTHNLVSGRFDLENQGSHSFKGASKKLKVFRVIREKPVPTKKVLKPLIGRSQEIELLFDRWERVKEGDGQVAIISGDAGIGKSRLIHELKRQTADKNTIKIECFCSPYYQNSFLYPVWDFLKRFLFNIEKSDIKNVNKLNITLKNYGLSKEFIETFSNFLNIAGKKKLDQLVNESPKKYRQIIFNDLIKWTLNESENHPVLFIVEDIHWSDPSTLEFLKSLSQNIPKSNIFLILTFRTGFNPDWDTKSYVTYILLNRLIKKHCIMLVNNILDKNDVSESILKEVVNRSDGNPLFLEEMTKILISSQYVKDNKLDILDQIPEGLNGLLMANLDRLKDEKDLVKLASVIGRVFSFNLIRLVSSLSISKLTKLLGSLVESEVLYMRGIDPDSEYYFKHHLIQEAAYKSLLRSEKKSYHKKVADVLETKFSAYLETQPELIAHHLTEAGLNEKAIHYWQKAGTDAIEHFAHNEAISHLKKALKLLDDAKVDENEKFKLEAEILITLGGALRVVNGFASKEVGNIYDRALELTRITSNETESFKVLRGLAGYYLAKAEYDLASEISEKSFALSKNLSESINTIQACYMLGAISLCRGNLNDSLMHSNEGMTLYNPGDHSSSAFLYGQDPGVGCLFWNAWAHWFLGYPDKALLKGIEALKLAESLSQPYSIAISMVLMSFIHYFRREPKQSFDYAQKSLNLSYDKGYEFFLEFGSILEGYALTELNQTDNGILKIRDGISRWIDIGAELFMPLWKTILAQAYNQIGKTDDALVNIEKAIDLANKKGELFYLPEIYRLKGEILTGTKIKNRAEIEGLFEKALYLSKEQRSRILELRSTVSLINYLKGIKDVREYLRILRKIYNSFGEGLDTRDLREAEQLIC